VVAALRPEKNIARLLRAFATLNTGRLVIVGDGPERGTLEVLTRSLGIAERVEFAGHRRDTAKFYARFNIFALTSDTEQMPLAVIEAMASGLPIVSTAVGDVPEMVAVENAPFITPLDDAAFAAALAKLAQDPVVQRVVGEANTVKARRCFDQTAMFTAHGALWRG
jgi:glycosyltransferase involved in cell wall biosynthesis